ncbi:MAG: hypothetical protein H7A44_06875 [Opitutaceae bacterium]|nr:hypothetical protein [Cephaloticoccus sp.]MCP5530146.1 hypothetical protein [Opitutaceae bacterium]
MAQSTTSRQAKIEEFSLPLFAFTVVTTLAGIFALLALVFPETWAAQFRGQWWQAVVVFTSVSMLACFIEFFFHRYVLHQPLVPFLRRLYRQHTLHHGLTHITRRNCPNGRKILVVENKFPILEPEQGEASFFPWFTLAVFGAILTPVLTGMQWLLPDYPWFLAGFLALACSLTLYELLHAINHWSLDKWLPLIEHPRWGWFWHPVYAFHLRHHAVIDCNESVSGFFGLPVADWVFNTCVIPKSIYADGTDTCDTEFTRPRPRWVIRKLDAWTHSVVQGRRQAKQADQAASSTDAPESDPILLSRKADARN